MKLAIYGPYGSGKTSLLYKYLGDYNKPLLITPTKIKINYYTTVTFRDLLRSFSNSCVIESIKEDYILYLIYETYFKGKGFRNFQEFLKESKNLLRLLFVKGISLNTIHSSNKLFSLFKKTYIEIISRLNKKGFMTYENLLDNHVSQLNKHFKDYDIIAVDDLEGFSIKEAKTIIQNSQNIIVTYSDDSLTSLLKKEGFNFKILPSRLNNHFIKKKVSNSLLYFYLKAINNSSNIAVMITKKTRRKIENFVRMNKIEVHQHKDIDSLYRYLSNIKYHKKNLSVEKPQILKELEEISKILDKDTDIIIRFLESYEDVFFYNFSNVFSNPLDLLGKKYEELYIESKLLTQGYFKSNKLYPNDFLPLDILFSNPLKENFYLSKANKVFVIEEDKDEKTDISINYVDERTKHHNLYSFSQITTYLSCPYKYMLKYVYNVPEEPTPFFVFGSIIHKLIELFSKRELKNKEEVVSSFDKMMNENKEVFRNHFDYYLKKGRKMLNNFFKYNEFLTHKYETKGVEMKIKIHLPQDIILVGVVDRLLYDKEDGKYVILDYKTSRPYKGRFDETHGKSQLMLYSHLINNEYNYDVKKIMLLFLENNSVVSYDIDQNVVNDVLSTIYEVVNKIKRKIFTPQPSSQCEYCSYKLLCRYWQGTR